MANTEYMEQYSKRPTVSRSELAKAVKAYVQERGFFKMAHANFFNEVIDAYFYEGYADGYAIAIELKGRFYDITRDEMEELDCVDSFHSSILQEKTKRWVIEEQILPPFDVGETINFVWGGESLTGIIYEVQSDVAKLVVTVDGSDGRPVIKYEDIIG